MSQLGTLYSPKGKALETAQQVLDVEKPLSINPAYGCTNECAYCYIPFIKKGDIRFPDHDVVETVKDQIENGVFEKHDPAVFMSFATDPFLTENRDVTMRLTSLFEKHGVAVATLSKLSLGDLSNKNMMHGMTIVSLDDGFWKEYEPRANRPWNRFTQLKLAHKMERKTWVSIEPYPTEDKIHQSFRQLLEKLFFVDFMIFGKQNYDKMSGTKDARMQYARNVDTFEDFCSTYGIKHWVKKETMEFIGCS